MVDATPSQTGRDRGVALQLMGYGECYPPACETARRPEVDAGSFLEYGATRSTVFNELDPTSRPRQARLAFPCRYGKADGDSGLVWPGYAFNTADLQLACDVYGGAASEAMSGLGETALGEGKDFGWAHSEHEHGPDIVSKAMLTDLVLPSPVPLLRPGNGEAVELL